MRTKGKFYQSTATLALATVLSLAAVQPSFAEDVLLKSKDGTISVRGDLTKYEDGTYTISTVLGVMNIAASNIICEGDGCPDLGAGAPILIAGSDTVGEGLMPLIIEGFAVMKDAVAEPGSTETGEQMTSLIGDAGFGDPISSFVTRSTSSSDGFTALSDSVTKIGMSSRRIRPEEARSLRDAGAGNMIDINQERIIAVDSIAVVVNPSNPITIISMENLDRIYSGLITNWSQLEGPNEPITVYTRPQGSGTASVFEQRIFAQSGRRVSNNLQTLDSNDAVSSAVAADRYAIGYVGSAFVRGAKPVSIAGICGIVSSPDSFAAKTEEYPLQRRLYMYNRADNLSENLQEFLDYAISEAADGVVAKSGFVNLAVDRVSQGDASGRIRQLILNTVDPFEFGIMRDLLVDLYSFDRLSTTFRFASGSSRLDGKALLDMDRLINYLQTVPAGTEVAFVGFSDSDGAFEANRALSLGRAQQVAQDFEQISAGKLSSVRLIAKGFGELAPAACNETLEGKRINRRVEVWISAPA